LKQISSILLDIFRFYYHGFRNSRTGKRLLVIVLIKFFIFFFILKLIFFPNLLKSKFINDKDRSEYVLKQLTKK